jgi:predicted anti-sigma-YlaC factor YlaD
MIVTENALPEDLACKEAVELFSDYLDGALSEELSALCEAHLRECSPCVTYLDQLRITVRSLRVLVMNGLPDEVKQTLLVRFREFKSQ